MLSANYIRIKLEEKMQIPRILLQKQWYNQIQVDIHWKYWCWSWSSNTLATWCKEPTHRKRPWCWEELKARGEGGDRGWDGWMASLTQWTWVWASSGRQWRTGKPGVLQSMGWQIVGHNLVTEQQGGTYETVICKSPWLFCWGWSSEHTLIKTAINKQINSRD